MAGSIGEGARAASIIGDAAKAGKGAVNSGVDFVEGIGPKMYEDTDFVAARLNALIYGKLPSEAEATVLKNKGIDLTDVIDRSVDAAKPSFERLGGMLKEAWSGLWLRWQDARFPQRLETALNAKAEAIESMTRAIQDYTRHIKAAENKNESLANLGKVYSKKFDEAKAAGDNSAMSRYGTLMENNNKMLEANNEIIETMTKAKKDLGSEQEVMREQFKADYAEKERLLIAREQGKNLDELDKNLRGALDKYTNLQSDIMRINAKVNEASKKAQQSAEQVVDGGQLGQVTV